MHHQRIASSSLLDTVGETCDIVEKNSDELGDEKFAIFLATSSYVALVLDTSRAQFLQSTLKRGGNGVTNPHQQH